MGKEIIKSDAQAYLKGLRGVVKSCNGFEVDVCRSANRMVYGDNRMSNMCEDVTFILYGSCPAVCDEITDAFDEEYPGVIVSRGDANADTIFEIARVNGRLYYMNNPSDMGIPLATRIEVTSKHYKDAADYTAFLCADAMHTHIFEESLVEASRDIGCGAGVLYIDEIKIPGYFCGLGVASYIFSNLHKFCAIGHIDAYGIFGMVYGDGTGYSRMAKAAYNNGFDLAPMKDYGFTVYCSYADMEEVFEEMRENYEQAVIEEGEEYFDDFDEEDFDEDDCCDWDCINCPRCDTCDCADDCDCDCDDDCENCSCEDDCDNCECCDGCEYKDVCDDINGINLSCEEEGCTCGKGCCGCSCADYDDEEDDDTFFEDCEEDCECHNCKGCCDGITENDDDDDDDDIDVRNCGGCGGCATKVSDNEADGSCYDCQHVGVCECNLLGFSTCEKKPDKKSGKKSK